MYSKILKPLIFSALVLLLLTGAAAAQEWVVTSPGDIDKVSSSTAVTLTNLTLRQAISKAVTGDTIVFAENISTVNIQYGSLNISRDITIGGNNKVTVRRDSSPITQEMPIFVVTGSHVAFRQLTVENGYTMNGSGGAFLIDNADVSLDSCTIQKNKAETGGAISVINGGSVRLNTVSIYKNNATNEGSAIYIKNGTVDAQNTIIEGHSDRYSVIKLEKGNLSLTDSRIVSNEIKSKGSPIDADAGTSIVVRGSTVAANSGTESAGISTKGSLTVENSIFENGKSTGAGGGISMREGSSGAIRYSLFRNNTANADGGGIYQTASSTVSITDCVFLNNVANYGGAFFGRGTFTIDSCTAVANAAKFYGGAIASWNNATATINGTILVQNEAKGNNTVKDPSGGGLNISRSDAVISNNVIVGNIDPRNIDYGEQEATVRSNGNNLVGVYRGTGRFPIEASDMTGVGPGSVFALDGSGNVVLTRSMGNTAGYEKIHLYTVELNSSPNNPASFLKGNQTPSQPPQNETPENTTPDQTEPGQQEPPEQTEPNPVWRTILKYGLIVVVSIILFSVIAYLFLSRERRKYR
jgi:hypothetical protein